MARATVVGDCDRTGSEADRGHLLGTRQQDLVKLRAVEVELGSPEMRLHRRTQLGAVEQPPVVPAHQVDGPGDSAGRAQRLLEAELVEKPDRVGPERQRRADLAGGRPLLEDLDVETALSERDRRGEAPDTRTHDHDTRHPS